MSNVLTQLQGSELISRDWCTAGRHASTSTTVNTTRKDRIGPNQAVSVEAVAALTLKKSIRLHA